MGPWEVVPDADRPAWPLDPLVGAGPLRLGMTSEEVRDALGESPPSSRHHFDRDGTDFHRSDRFSRIGVTAYYTGSTARLQGIAIDAQIGPQVVFEGMRLVGRVPSVLDQEIAEFTERLGYTLYYTHEANPAVGELGLVIRVQRSGDAVLTRPLLGVQNWAEDPWSAVPGDEWKIFC